MTGVKGVTTAKNRSRPAHQPAACDRKNKSV